MSTEVGRTCKAATSPFPQETGLRHLVSVVEIHFHTFDTTRCEDKLKILCVSRFKYSGLCTAYM